MKNTRYNNRFESLSSFFLVALLILIIRNSVTTEYCLSAVETNKNESVTEAEQKEHAAVERFWGLLERAPRRGTALDRVYGYYVDTGQVEGLLEKCRELTTKSPNDSKVWLLHGLISVRRNDDIEAVSAFEKSESLDTSNYLASFYLGETLIAQGKLKEAAEALERALERKPAKTDLLLVMQMLGRVYERFGDKNKALDIWNRMEEAFP
ncbi:MAG: tetratricopeptide repeat protein, partial [Thermoguttaceae bacterium]